jgi:hypothetical protein
MEIVEVARVVMRPQIEAKIGPDISIPGYHSEFIGVRIESDDVAIRPRYFKNI